MRLIDADAADVERIVCYYGDNCRIEDVQEWLDEQPTIGAAPVRRGEWKYEKIGGKTYCFCSECGDQPMRFEPNFCPNCGAQMSLPENGVIAGGDEP